MIKKAIESLKEISSSEEAREIARMREKARLDFESEVSFAIKEGKAQSRFEFLKIILQDELIRTRDNKALAKLCGLSEEEVAEARKHLN